MLRRAAQAAAAEGFAALALQSEGEELPAEEVLA